MIRKEIINKGYLLNKEVAYILGKEMKNVSFLFCRGYRRLGYYSYKKSSIYISENVTEDDSIKQVLLHELCHVYQPKESKPHGKEFKLNASVVSKHFNIPIGTRAVGFKIKKPESAGVATLTCERCGHIYVLNSRRSRAYQLRGIGCHCGVKTTIGKCGGNLIFEESRGTII